jgi:hypothetical protein
MRWRLTQGGIWITVLAIAALGIVTARACLQAITIDEATSFLQYARNPQPSHWWPVSDNHVLNSLLMRLITTIVGVSNLSVRLPAILGAIIYIASAVYLSLLVTGRTFLRLLLFVCLVYNPMILDYLVAARGYSLAIGFFLAAVAVIASSMITAEGQVKILEKCAWVSALLALSSAANFSFSIANGVTLTIFFVWAARQYGAGRGGYLRVAAASCLPGLLLGGILSGSVVLNLPRSELYFGSQAMSEMWSGFAKGTFDELNPDVLNPLLLRWFSPLQRLGPWLVALAGLFFLGYMETMRARAPGSKKEPLGNFVRLLALVFGAALLLHWLAFKLAHIPLPKDRTGLFFLPLWTLAIAGSVAFAFRAANQRALPWMGIAVLSITAFYFAGCLRLGYFREWRFDSDTKTLYWILNDLHQRCGSQTFGIDWRYHLPLNFYREDYGTGLKEFSGSTSGELPAGRDAYAIFLPTSEDFIKQQKLHVIYRNPESEASIAIRGCPADAHQAVTANK